MFPRDPKSIISYSIKHGEARPGSPQPSQRDGGVQSGWLGGFTVSHKRSKYNPGEILIIDSVASPRPGPEQAPDHFALGRGGARRKSTEYLVRSRARPVSGLRAAPSLLGGILPRVFYSPLRYFPGVVFAIPGILLPSL